MVNPSDGHISRRISSAILGPRIKLCHSPSISCYMDDSDVFHLEASLRTAGPPMPVALEMGKTAIQEVLPLERVREYSYLLGY